MRFCSDLGDGSAASAIRSSSGGGSSSASPKPSTKSFAAMRCCGSEQWFSSERISGYGDVAKASSAMAATTSSRPILPHSVRPCVTIG